MSLNRTGVVNVHCSGIACRDWTGSPGSCRHGAACYFSHDVAASSRQVSAKCRAWTGVPGSCRFGSLCRFLHVDCSPDTGKDSAVEPSEGGLAKNQGDTGALSEKLLNPLAAEFVPKYLSSDAGPVALFVPPQPHETHDGAIQPSHVSVPVPRVFAHAICSALGRIQVDVGGQIYYDSLSEAAVITGTPAQQKSACAEIALVMDEAARRQSAECCVCFEAPGGQESMDGRPGRYGILEGCDHIVCMSCIMKWRQNEEMTREARLGCPVCRATSHIIVPWPESVSGAEKMTILKQHKERCRATPCKWSTKGQRCPAGKHCIFDHTGAPQIVEPRRRRMEMDIILNDDDLLLRLLDAMPGFGDDADVETDDEIAAIVEALYSQRHRLLRT